MTILNKDELYYLGTPWNAEPFKELRNDIFVWPYYHESDELFYCFDFANGNAFDIFPLDTLLNDSQLNEIRNGAAKLVLSNSHEAFHHVVNDIYQHIVIRFTIPADQIILLSESADIASHIKTVSKQLNLPEIKSRWMRRFEYDIQDNMKRMNQFPSTLENKQYDKKFLCFNRRWRGNRVALVALLYALDLIKYGHVSLGKADDNRDWHSMYYRIKNYMSPSVEGYELLEQVEHDLLTNQPLFYLDSTDLTVNRAVLNEDTNYLYGDTYFSVVTETLFFEREKPGEYGRFLSEKTFKPVAMNHPFIIVSTPNFLVKFRELGYKSFSPYINEEYDNELDDAKRMMKIAKEIERLSKLSPTELEDFLVAMREICEYNYNILINKKDFVTDL